MYIACNKTWLHGVQPGTTNSNIMTDTQNILFEMLSSITNEEYLQENVSFEDVVAEAVDTLQQYVNFEDVDTIFTGMNENVTRTLTQYVEENDIDVEVTSFYPNVSKWAEEDEIDYNQAWKEGFTWRNNQLFTTAGDDEVHLTVRVGDAGASGQALLEQSRQKGVDALDLNLDHLIDRDAVYGNGDTTANASA